MKTSPFPLLTRLEKGEIYSSGYKQTENRRKFLPGAIVRSFAVYSVKVRQYSVHDIHAPSCMYAQLLHNFNV